jgi:hypothetical protein
MAGRGNDFQGGVAETHLVGRIEVEVDRGHGADLHAEDRTARCGVVQQELVLAREGEGDAVGIFEKLHAQRMVEVPVGVDRHAGVQPARVDELFEPGVLALVGVAGVDDDALVRVVPHHVGVFADRIELQRCYFHIKVKSICTKVHLFAEI